MKYLMQIPYMLYTTLKDAVKSHKLRNRLLREFNQLVMKHQLAVFLILLACAPLGFYLSDLINYNDFMSIFATFSVGVPAVLIPLLIIAACYVSIFTIEEFNINKERLNKGLQDLKIMVSRFEVMAIGAVIAQAAYAINITHSTTSAENVTYISLEILKWLGTSAVVLIIMNALIVLLGIIYTNKTVDIL